MEKRIDLEKRGREANQVIELILDNCRSTSIVGLTDEFTALETLSLINVGLTTLKGFPALPNLRKLELSDNRISNGLKHLATSPKLTHLNLSGNKIKELDELKALAQFESLHALDLFNNEATQIDSYRQKIFAMLPSLKYLDGFDANDVEALSDCEEEEELEGNESEGDDGSDDDEEGVDDEEDDEDDDDDDDDDDEGDVSLSELYNDNLEEDNSDYEVGQQNGAEKDDDSEDNDDDEDETTPPSKTTENAAVAAGDEAAEPEGSSSRGKKRKIDGE